MRPLTEEERARISDGKQNIQAASDALSGIDGSVIPNLKAIEECLAEADTSLREALRAVRQSPRSSQGTKNGAGNKN